MVVEVVGTPSIMNTKSVINVDDITIGDPLDWPVLPVGLGKRICSSFDHFLVTLYECMFARIRLQLSFSDFEVVVHKHLKVFPSQLHPGACAYKTEFQFCVEYKSSKPSLGLFFDLFYIGL